jgi:arylsulfatase A-like enzyme
MKAARIISLLLILLCGRGLAATAPNVVIFLIDDMGVMDTSVPFLTDANGKPRRYPLNDFYRTPNMERLAARGVRFNNFYAMSVCSPTRIAIMTGQNAARNRTTNWINPDNNNAGPKGPPEWNWQGLKKGNVTLPGLLRANGYRTIHVGKGHFAPRAFEGANPANIGFDVNVAGASIGAPGSYYGMQNFDRPKNAKAKGKGKAKAGAADHAVHGLEKYHGQDIFLTEALTLEAKAHVGEAVKAEKPFFLYFAHYAVHAPFNSDPRFAAHYKDSGKPPEAQAFATLIEGMDKSLGDMLDHLEALGVAENTLVLFLGDNGSDAPLGHQHEVACAAPLRGKKGAHYEGGMRVPFIAAWAKPNADHEAQKRLPITANAIQPQQAAVQDLLPTVLNLAGVAAPAGHQVDGRKLDTLLTGRADAAREEKFLMHYPHAPHRSDYWTSYREGDWKVIYHYFPTDVSGGSHYQLFNLKADPFEQNDLAGKSAVELKRMMERLIAELEAHNAVYPVGEDGKTPAKPKLPGIASARLKPDSDGFVSLFNGRNLKGWSGDPQYWSVEDGAITGRTDGTLKMNRFLTWEGSTIRNFDLRVKVKVTAGGNSGLQYRGAMRHEIGPDIVSGYQCDIVANNPGYNGMLYEERGRRILSHTGEKVIVAPDGQPWIVGTMPVQTFAADEWHEYRVLVRGNHHQHWIDGHLTADLMDFDEKGRSLDGVLGVQVHVGPAMKIQFKDFKIQFLPDDLPLLKFEDHPIPAGATGVKPQGKLPKDWQPPVYRAK